MTFLMIVIGALLMTLMFTTYKSLPAVAITILVVFGTTTLVLVLGISGPEGRNGLMFITTLIPRRQFMHMMILWYVIDVICAAKIVRNYLAYRHINRERSR